MVRDVAVIVPRLAGAGEDLHHAARRAPASGRATRQASLNWPRPYRSRVACVSRLRSKTSCASNCMRKAISIDWMRASSGLSLPPRACRCISLKPRIRSTCSRWAAGSEVAVGEVLQHAARVEVRVVDVRALEDAGQEAVAPELRADDREAGAHRHEAGQVLVLGAQAVEQPRSHARPNRLHVAAGHHQQRRLMVGHVGVHRADDAQVVGMLARHAGRSR